MKKIIEIPLFANNVESFLNLFPDSEKIDLKSYQSFSVVKKALDFDHEIYFYLLNAIPESNNAQLLDKIIPYAPFCLMFSDVTESLQALYTSRYATPLYILRPGSEALEEAPQTEISYLTDDERTIEQIIKQAIERTKALHMEEEI